MNESQRRAVSLAFIALVVIFLCVYLARIDYRQLARLAIDWPLLIVATFVAMMFRYWGAYIWQVILRELGTISLPSFSTMSSIHAKAWMGRYIPGKVAWIAGRVYLAHSLGISKSRIAVSAFLESAMQILAFLTVSMLFLGADPRLNKVSALATFALLSVGIVCLLAATPRIFNAVVRRAYLLVKKQQPGPELSVNGKAALKSFYLHSIGAMLSGTSFFLLVKAVDPTISLDLYLFCVGAYNLAGVAGMVTPILPSGLGVRDGMLLVLLNIVLPAEIAIALTVLSRLWSVAVDILFYCFSTIIVQNRKIPAK